MSNAETTHGRARTAIAVSLSAIWAVLAPLAVPAGANSTPGSVVVWGLNDHSQVSTAPAGSDFVAVDSGIFHSVALRSDGSVVGWGDSTQGQHVGTPTEAGFTAVSAGGYYNMALRPDGSIASWGNNDAGQVSQTPAGGGFIAVAAGGFHGLALRADGSLAAWGFNSHGQVSATPTGTGFTAVSAGNHYSLALRADGSLVAWGYDGAGQVSATPTGPGFVAVAAGGVHGLALRSDGSIAAWGTNVSIAGTPAGTGFTTLSAGNFHNLALRSDGSIAAWGANTGGSVSATPTGAGFVAVAAGSSHSVALRPPALTSIAVTPANASVDRGSTAQLAATGSYDNGSQRDLTGSAAWASVGPQATVSASGLVTGRQVGQTSVSATSGAITGSATLTVNPSSLVVQGPALAKAYGAAVPALPPSYVGLVLSDTAPATPAICATTASATSAIGSYLVTCSGAADTNYAISYATGTLVVNPVALTVVAPSLSKAYGAGVPALTPSYAGLVNGDMAPATAATCTTTATVASPAGSYLVTCSGAADGNYAITYSTGTLTVTKTELTVQGPAASKAYGAGVPALAPTYVGLVNGDTAPATPATCSTAATASSPVGSYAVACSGASDANYSISYAAGSLVVHGAELVVRGASASKVYGAGVPPLAPTYLGLVNGDTAPATPATCGTTATAASNAGTYPVTCSGAADPNYTVTDAPGTLTVTRAALTVQAPSTSTSYGAVHPALTPSYGGLVNGDTAPATPATCSTPATPASGAGAYPVSCSGAADQNYDVSYASGTLTITKVDLTVSADDQARAYGQPNPPLTVSYSGFVLGQTRVTSDLSGEPACSTPAGPASVPGGYPITCSAGTLSSANYSFMFDPGTLTVGRTGTELTAQPLGLVRSLLTVSATMSANLRSELGQPLAGERVTFTMGGRSCSGTTDGNGNASCSLSLISALLNPGSYTAGYAGSSTSEPSSATGRITLL